MVLSMARPTLDIILAKPRGFCAGVERAIDIVEKALIKYGAPVYVRHEIVHNQFVVQSLRQKGAVFVNEISEIPEGSITIFSAHGVSCKVEEDAKQRNLPVIDATCPLVKKVHKEAINHDMHGRQLILIGHSGHPEVEGTSGRINKDVLIVQNVHDANSIQVANPDNLAYVTQTTLSVDDTKQIITALKRRFPAIIGPDVKDICYATQNRQDAVKKLAQEVQLVLVIGAQNSSNSNRLRDLGIEKGVPSYLINDAEDLHFDWFTNISKIGITAGASAPEILLEHVLAKLSQFYELNVSTLAGVEENVKFKLPKELSTIPEIAAMQNAGA